VCRGLQRQNNATEDRHAVDDHYVFVFFRLLLGLLLLLLPQGGEEAHGRLAQAPALLGILFLFRVTQ